MELTESNIAAWTIAIILWAKYGFVPPRLAIARTAAMPFSSQSVMTLAKADCAVPIRTTANSPLQRLEDMLRSSGVGNPRVWITASLSRSQHLG
jgi:hypothetical protein